MSKYTVAFLAVMANLGTTAARVCLVEYHYCDKISRVPPSNMVWQITFSPKLPKAAAVPCHFTTIHASPQPCLQPREDAGWLQRIRNMR